MYPHHEQIVARRPLYRNRTLSSRLKQRRTCRCAAEGSRQPFNHSHYEPSRPLARCHPDRSTGVLAAAQRRDPGNHSTTRTTNPAAFSHAVIPTEAAAHLPLRSGGIPATIQPFALSTEQSQCRHHPSNPSLPLRALCL